MALDELGLEQRVEQTTRDLVQAINDGDPEMRLTLRELAVGILRDEVFVPDRSTAPAGVGGQGTFNAFGVGIPLVLMGSVLIFLFPLLGLVMFAGAALMIAWGVAATLWARS